MKELQIKTDAEGTMDKVRVAEAEQLATARTILTNLASTQAVAFDGTQDITPGVTGVLSVPNGGTGATDLATVTVGNATNAINATNDGSGNNIENTYVKNTTPLKGIFYIKAPMEITTDIGDIVSILPSDLVSTDDSYGNPKVGDTIVDMNGTIVSVSSIEDTYFDCVVRSTPSVSLSKLTINFNDENVVYQGTTDQTITISSSNPNLLYNSNFAINQRGNSSYSTSGYTLDGWQKTSSSGYVYIKTGAYAPMNQAIYFSAYSGVYIRQFLEIDLKPFTYYTVSIAYSTSSTVTSPTEISYTFYFSQTSSQSFTWTPISGYQVYIYKPSYSSSSHSYVRIGRTSSSASTIYIFWIKLEEGRKATPYEIPDPATELLKCQRYYLKQTTGCQIPGSVGNGGNYGYVTLWLPVPMRTTTPTIVSYSVGGIRLQGNSYSTVTSISDGVLAGTAFYFKYDSSAKYDSFQPVSMALDAIELSAELTS